MKKTSFYSKIIITSLLSIGVYLTSLNNTTPVVSFADEEHIVESSWSNDDDHHWHECSCGEKHYYEAHDFYIIENLGVHDIDNPNAGNLCRVKCSVCEYVTTRVLLSKDNHFTDGVYYYDETHHWMESYESDYTEKLCYEEHNFVIKSSTREVTNDCTSDVIKHYECSCGATKDVNCGPEYLTHKSDKYKKYYYIDSSEHFQYCVNPNCSQHVNVSPHNMTDYMDYINDSEDCRDTWTDVDWCATCGFKSYIYDVHMYDDHEYDETSWDYDDTTHYHKCSHSGCISRIDESEHTIVYNGDSFHNNNCTEYVEHNYGCSVCEHKEYTSSEPIYTEHEFETTLSFDNQYHYYACSHDGCSAYKNRSYHTYNDPVITRIDPSDCEIGNRYTYTCKTCGYSVSYDVKDSDSVHTASSTSTYIYDENGHWKACEREGCTGKANYEEHSFTYDFVNAATGDCTESLKATAHCKKCGYSTILDITVEEEQFDSFWTYDSEGHWHPCTHSHDGCNNKKDFDYHTLICHPGSNSHYFTCAICNYYSKDEPHNYEMTSYRYLYNNCTYNAKVTYTCKDCGVTYEKTHTINDEHIPVGDWISDETGHWKDCDREGCSAKADFSEHDYKSEGPDSTCSVQGHKHKTCLICGYETDETLPLTDHNYVYHSKEEPTRNSLGNLAYYTCSTCDKLFIKKATGYIEVSADVLILRYESDRTSLPKEVLYLGGGVIAIATFSIILGASVSKHNKKKAKAQSKKK